MSILRLALILWLCTLPLCAQELFVRNQAFKGASSGTGKSMLVEAAALAQALELSVIEANGGLLIGQGDSGALAPQTVQINGVAMPASLSDSGALMIELGQAAEALGAKLVHNTDLGTLDLYLAPTTTSPVPNGSIDDWEQGWQPDVSARAIPEGPLRGKIGETRFELVQASSFGSTLTLKGPRQTISVIALKEGLVSGHEFRIGPEERMTGTHLRVEWVDDNGTTQKQSYMNGYSMHLVLADPTDGEVEAGIYLTLPDRSVLKGNFIFPVK